MSTIPRSPARVIPRRRAERLRFFEGLWLAIELDAIATADELRADGWADAAIGGALEDYRAWITGNVSDAVDLGCFAAGVAVAA